VQFVHLATQRYRPFKKGQAFFGFTWLRESVSAQVAGSIPTQGEIKKKSYILSRDSEVTLSHWSLSTELVIMSLIDL
jgi:hypothetical protein